jgi:transcriptional regulator with XRE-family HTH domain
MRRKAGETNGQMLRRWRESAQLTQAEAAKAVGTTQARWSLWESGESHPKLAKVLRIEILSKGELSLRLLAGEN